jgi:BirA family biotin operon repressor/biotin-[acetyl-CoA-carboxylase] ligase
MPDEYTAREVWRLPTRHVGRQVHVFDRVDSTNRLAFAFARGDDWSGQAFLADEQTAGRGQHGRTWTAPPRSGVLLSVLLRPPPPMRRPVVLTAWAAVAVRQVVQQLTHTSPRIKWPNDVLVDCKKICGILIEQSQQGGEPVLVAGVGLNVEQSSEQLRAAGLPAATSLRACGGQADAYNVARRLLLRLDEEYDRVCQGDSDALQANWREGLGLLGQVVSAECADGVRQGRVLELAFDGVVLEEAGGAVVLSPESILHIEPVR